MTAENTQSQANWQLKIEHVLAKPFIQHGIVALIFINAILLGMETSPWIMSEIGEELHILDHTIGYIHLRIGSTNGSKGA